MNISINKFKKKNSSIIYDIRSIQIHTLILVSHNFFSYVQQIEVFKEEINNKQMSFH